MPAFGALSCVYANVGTAALGCPAQQSSARSDWGWQARSGHINRAQSGKSHKCGEQNRSIVATFFPLVTFVIRASRDSLTRPQQVEDAVEIFEVTVLDDNLSLPVKIGDVDASAKQPFEFHLRRANIGVNCFFRRSL